MVLSGEYHRVNSMHAGMNITCKEWQNSYAFDFEPLDIMVYHVSAPICHLKILDNWGQTSVKLKMKYYMSWK